MSDALTARQREYDAILVQAEQLQKQYEGKRWEPKDREKFEALCAEGKVLQDDIEADKKYAALQSRDRQLQAIPEVTLPNPQNGKATGHPNEIAGYVSLGDAVLASESFQQYAKNGYPTGRAAIVQLAWAAIHGKNVVRGQHGEPLVPLTRESRKAYEGFMETKEAKAVPTLGTGVIDPDRLARMPQVTADIAPTIRDVISTGTTTSNAVEYVREEAVTGAAAITAHGDVKPELALEYTLQSAPVRTIAAWIPVQKQQLDDWSQLRGLIDGRLRYKVKQAEEAQVFFGPGTGINLTGLLNVSGIQDIATNGRYNSSTHTLIDAVRMGITDVFVAGYNPNAVVMHPYEWEEILLEKGSDARYVWAVVTDNNGSRIWGLRVVESRGMVSTVAGEVGRREVLVGDFNVGAQLVDRMDLTVQVGLVNDQFVRNMLTILAEERIALPIYAPAAFAHLTTEAGGS